MHRVRALLFLWLIEKETHAADKVKESIARQIEKILHDGEKHQSINRPTTIKKNEVNDVLANYDMAIKKVEEHLTDNIAKGKFLSEQIIGLEQQGIHIASKYEASEASLAQVKHPTEIHGDLSHEEIANHIHDAINQYNTKIQQHTDKITVTNPSNDVTQLMQQLINLNLNLLCYREMLLVHQGQYQYFNAKGDPASFRDAHFLLEKGDNQKIVEHEGVIYLLKPEQDLNSIKESPEAQQQAKQHYEQSKHVVMTVMRGFHHQKSIETAENKNQLEIAKTQLTQNQQEHVLMENQRNLLQSARAGVQNLHNSGQEAPRPTPTAGNASLTKPSQASATQFYREQIQSIQASERTPECLFNLISKAPGDRKAASSYLEIALANLPRNKPIPTIIMQSLLKNMERFGVDATKSSVTSIENPLEASHKTPSPLRTIPDPYKV